MGGMGSVYSATHLQLGNQVAIKVLHPQFAADHEAVVRFQREARIISGLQHKHILAVYAFSSWRGIVYMAMELVEGHSLGQQIADSGPLKAEQAVPLLLQICDAMTFAHKNDVLHRDLKPDNVIVVKSEEKLSTATVKVVDFGLAKLQGDNDMQRLTRTGEVLRSVLGTEAVSCRQSSRHLDETGFARTTSAASTAGGAARDRGDYLARHAERPG
ncbi:MAG: serine/threonine-protein kinase [Candidatus Obscuribacterales bacterium]